MYTKFQIALQYFPQLMDKPDLAVHRLRQWIVRNHELMARLKAVGYSTKSKRFSKRQRDLIYEYLGEP